MHFTPYVNKRSVACSVITHTPTQKSSMHSVALSAITHTPTEKQAKESVALSALHLSQKLKDEDASYRSIALSAVKVIESKLPNRHGDNSRTNNRFDYEEDKVSQPPSRHRSNGGKPWDMKNTNSKKTVDQVQPSVHEPSSVSITPTKHDHSCQVYHGRDQEESNSSLKVDRDIALDPYLKDQSVDAWKRNNGNQFRLSQKTASEESKNINKMLQVSEDLTAQVNFNGDKSIQMTPQIGTI